MVNQSSSNWFITHAIWLEIQNTTKWLFFFPSGAQTLVMVVGSSSVIDLATFTHIYYIHNVQPYRICYTGMLVYVRVLRTERGAECGDEQRCSRSRATVQHHSVHCAAALALWQQDEQHWRQQKQPVGSPINACELVPLRSNSVHKLWERKQSEPTPQT